MNKYNAVVTRTIKHTRDICEIFFTLENGRIFDYESGQYVTVFKGGSSVPEGKAYSLASAPHELEMSIVVKKIGEFSGYLHALNGGDTFEISQNYGYFNPETDDELVCFAAGVGISPIWSILKAEVYRLPNRMVTLHYSNKTAKDIVFYDDIQQICTLNDNFKIWHYITREKVPLIAAVTRRIDASKIKVPEGAKYLLCGHVEFVRDIRKNLLELGVKGENISTEVFFE